MSNLKDGKMYIRRLSAVHNCPVHPEKRSRSWEFNKNEKIEYGDWRDGDWEKGGVVVQCIVHGHCSDNYCSDFDSDSDSDSDSVSSEGSWDSDWFSSD